MKSLVFACLGLALVLAGCRGEHPHYTADLKITPEPIEARKPTDLIFQVKNPKGEKTSELEIVHEKPMHLFMVSEDLSQYFHEHPEKQADGTYKLTGFVYPNGGKFKIYIDFRPKGEEDQTVESFVVDVEGEGREEVELVPDEKFEKIVDGLRVVMKPNIDLVKRKDVMFMFQMFDAETDAPATDLQTYLGEKAHFVIIRKGLGRFVHAHPMSSKTMTENTNSNMKMPDLGADPESKVVAMTNFPNRGIYKIFAQFKRNGKVITVPFVFRVE